MFFILGAEWKAKCSAAYHKALDGLTPEQRDEWRQQLLQSVGESLASGDQNMKTPATMIREVEKYLLKTVRTFLFIVLYLANQ